MPVSPSVSAPAPAATSSAWRWWQWLLLVLAVLVGAAAVAVLTLDSWLRPLLEKQVATQSKGQYELRIGNLRTRLAAGSISLRNVHLRSNAARQAATDSAARLPEARLDVGRLDIAGIGLWQLIKREVVPVKYLGVDSLCVRLTSVLPTSSASDSVPLHKQLPLGLAGLRLNRVVLQRLQGAYHPRNAPDSMTLRQLDVRLHDVLVSAEGAADRHRLGYANGMDIVLLGGSIAAFKHCLNLGGMRFSLQKHQLQLDSLLVQPRLSLRVPKTTYARIDLLLPRVEVAGLRIRRLLRRHRLKADTLRVVLPRLALDPPTITPEPLHELLKPWLGQIELRHLALTKGSLYVAGLPQKPNVQNINLVANELCIDSASAGAPGRLYYARNWLVDTGPATALLDGPYYRVAYQRVHLETLKRRLHLRNLRLQPKFATSELSRRKGYQAPNVTLLVPDLDIQGFDFPALIRRRQLVVRQVELRNAVLQTRGDGRFPLNPKRSVATPDMIGRLPFRVDIRRLSVYKGTFYSQYRAPLNPVRGRFAFTDFDITLRNISNDPRRMSRTSPATGYASALLQNRCRITARLSANLLDPSGYHLLTGQLGAASLHILNPMTVESTNLLFKSGEVQNIRFQMGINRRRSWGTVWAQYSDLKVAILAAPTNDNRKNIKTRLLTGVVNLVVRNKNPRGGELKPGTINSDRNLNTSVFTIWQHGLTSGLLNSVGIPAKMSKSLSE
ncbi:hypothetical protein J0X19_19535 [Hymenobacter sp. BT186]|uniref:Uncharacterized protein n=1 Tax=Hymenobacter telluris TaxID=2816474 RepID=A0A939JEN9_9BACT|nr:hypothetical protein [Hymenobacter telluris]MBO0360163.1 hypothetical protein [Hymenobacter telluris]MBW3376190.1 hypothetical protein [Hymenobacter norwichensis]